MRVIYKNSHKVMYDSCVNMSYNASVKEQSSNRLLLCSPRLSQTSWRAKYAYVFCESFEQPVAVLYSISIGKAETYVYCYVYNYRYIITETEERKDEERKARSVWPEVVNHQPGVKVRYSLTYTDIYIYIGLYVW